MIIARFYGIGRRRRQEDAQDMIEMRDGRALAVVADGMGGHGCGDEASVFVVKSMAQYWQSHAKEPDSEEKICAAVAEVGAQYEAFANGREMGTTLAMAAIDGRTVHIAHCGDSRIYFRRKANGWRFETIDHTRLTPEGWELVANAFFTGACADIKPEVRRLDVEPGDRLMLCTDGVFKSLDEADIWLALSSVYLFDAADDIENACLALASDNYSAILLEF